MTETVLNLPLAIVVKRYGILHLKTEAADWCTDNCNGLWSTRAELDPNARHTPAYKLGRWDGCVNKIEFELERDALLFKMFWL